MTLRIEDLLFDSDNLRDYHYYTYSFSPSLSKIKQQELAKHIQNKFKKPDYYYNLLQSQTGIVREIVHDLLPLKQTETKNVEKNLERTRGNHVKY